MSRSFIGRDREMAILEGEYTRQNSFILMTGRRRIGKTRLISEFIHGKDALYFFANKTSSLLLLEGFSRAVSGYFGTNAVYPTWKDALTAYAKDGAKRILVIDEFQNIMYAEEDIASVLQDTWDQVLSDSGIMLILCGSHISVMEELAKNYDSPLYGRFTRHMTVGPLSFDTVKGDDYVESVKRYAIHGGVPRYMELLGKGDLNEAVRLDVMDPSSIMFDDPLVLMDDEVKSPGGYMSILSAIAHGNRRMTDIASALQTPTTSLTSPLKRLTDMRMVRREVPVTESEEKSRNGLYQITDNYTAFWFRFVVPYMSALQIGEYDGAMAHFRAHFAEHHASFVFEEICRRSVYSMTDAIGFIPSRVGRYWSKNVELDVVALDTDGKRAFVGECKFRSEKPVGRHDLMSLLSDCSEARELDKYDIIYGLFSVTGFEEQLYGMDVILVDKGKIVHGIEGRRRI